MAGGVVSEPCPFCERTTKPHCEKAPCDWLRCTNLECSATVHPGRRRAMRINPSTVTTEYVTY